LTESVPDSDGRSGRIEIITALVGKADDAL
jgi:hypothetical protein